jgi:hypothetical protein
MRLRFQFHQYADHLATGRESVRARIGFEATGSQ